jgi:hypothetical protein
MREPIWNRICSGATEIENNIQENDTSWKDKSRFHCTCLQNFWKVCKYSFQLRNGVFWEVTPCGSCKNRRFGGTLRLHHLEQGWNGFGRREHAGTSSDPIKLHSFLWTNQSSKAIWQLIFYGSQTVERDLLVWRTDIKCNNIGDCVHEIYFAQYLMMFCSQTCRVQGNLCTEHDCNYNGNLRRVADVVE